MARKQKNEMAEYECVTYGGCVVHIKNPSGDGTIEQLFRMNDGDVPYNECMLSVPKGEVVCQHFEPYNEVADADRDDQMEHPEKYIKHEHDTILLAEIMVKKGFFGSKQEGVDALNELVSDKDLAKTDDIVREEAIAKLSRIGKDEKESRSILGKKLKDGGVTGFFPGAKPQALATLVYDNDLHE